MSHQKRKCRSYIDLFAGCGGLSLGLEEAGFQPILVNELNQDAMETYILNREKEFPQLRTYSVNDVKDLVLNDSHRDDIIAGIKKDYGIDIKKGELDLLVGGPPCQGFSGIGHRRSYSVEKEQLPSNHLFEDMAYLISIFRPKIFLFENVKGLLSAKWTSTGTNGEIWDDIISTFKAIPDSASPDYVVRAKLVHAKEYGIPQNRPRILMVGIRNDIGNYKDCDEDAVKAGFLPEPQNNYPDLIDLLGDLIDPHFVHGGATLSYLTDPQNEIQRHLRTNPRTGECLKMGETLTDQEYSKHTQRVIQKFKYMIENNSEIPDEFKTKKFAQRVLPARWGKNGPTITATTLPDDYVHFSQPRILTVREWARLQTFPDWYVFHGKRTTGGIRRAGNPREGIHERELPRYTQIGNAVPVGLARAIGLNFMKVLDAHDA